MKYFILYSIFIFSGAAFATNEIVEYGSFKVGDTIMFEKRNLQENKKNPRFSNIIGTIVGFNSTNDAVVEFNELKGSYVVGIENLRKMVLQYNGIYLGDSVSIDRPPGIKKGTVSKIFENGFIEISSDEYIVPQVVKHSAITSVLLSSARCKMMYEK